MYAKAATTRMNVTFVMTFSYLTVNCYIKLFLLVYYIRTHLQLIRTSKFTCQYAWLWVPLMNYCTIVKNSLKHKNVVLCGIEKK